MPHVALLNEEGLVINSKANVENPITNSENSMIPHAAKNNTKLFCKKVVASIYSSFIRI
jgi:hypothetical protein